MRLPWRRGGVFGIRTRPARAPFWRHGRFRRSPWGWRRRKAIGGISTTTYSVGFAGSCHLWRRSATGRRIRADPARRAPGQGRRPDRHRRAPGLRPADQRARHRDPDLPALLGDHPQLRAALLGPSSTGPTRARWPGSTSRWGSPNPAELEPSTGWRKNLRRFVEDLVRKGLPFRRRAGA